MKEIFEIFKQIESTNSRNEKEFILKQNQKNNLLKKVLEYTYNPYKIYGIGKKSFSNQESDISQYENLFDLLDYLNSNNSSDITKYQVNTFLNNQTEEDKEWYKRIILKDLKIGITETTINKIWDKLIPKLDVMLAKSYWDFEENIKGRHFILTMKLNGHRGIIIKDGNIKMFTRQGQLYEGLVEIEEDVKKLPDGYVYDGEFTISNYANMESKDVYKETSKVIRKDGVKTGLVFRAFDIIPVKEFFDEGKSSLGCDIRKNYLNKLLGELNLKHIEEVPILYYGNNQEVIKELLDEVTSKGEEGLMLNLSDGKYECKRSKNILKIKKFKDADVLVTNIIEGDGKNKGKLGAITVKFEYEGKYHECECGSGFSDHERELYFRNPELLIGKIVQIKYFEITSNAKGGCGLQFPTWESIIRHDKTEISMY